MKSGNRVETEMDFFGRFWPMAVRPGLTSFPFPKRGCSVRRSGTLMQIRNQQKIRIETRELLMGPNGTDPRYGKESSSESFDMSP
jgi:hypothetical protein